MNPLALNVLLFVVVVHRPKGKGLTKTLQQQTFQINGIHVYSYLSDKPLETPTEYYPFIYLQLVHDTAVRLVVSCMAIV